MHAFYDYLYYYQNALQKATQIAFTRRLYSVHAARPQRAHGALEDPTAFQQRSNSVPAARCLTHCANAKPRRLF